MIPLQRAHRLPLTGHRQHGRNTLGACRRAVVDAVTLLARSVAFAAEE